MCFARSGHVPDLYRRIRETAFQIIPHHDLTWDGHRGQSPRWLGTVPSLVTSPTCIVGFVRRHFKLFRTMISHGMQRRYIVLY